MQTFSLIGCGKVGTSIARRLVEKGFSARWIYNRTVEKATELCSEIGGQVAHSLQDVSSETNWIIISVSDDYVGEVSEQLESTTALVTHTSGVLAPEVLAPRRKGYFYPLQTFNKDRIPDWSMIPIFIQASNENDRDFLREQAGRVGSSAHEITAEQKKQLHLAAVFTNNFTNHMLTIAERIAEEKQLDFSIFHALLRETVEKAIAIGPKNAQTGPAVRGDQKTIEQHLALLPDDLKELYKITTQDIQKNK